MAETKSALSYVPGGSSEAEEVNRRYMEAQQKLLDTLDARKNRLFDPVLLAMAEGFLAPTQSGRFGEALGRVAGNVNKAQAALAKEDQELAQLRLQLAQQGLTMQQQKEREATLKMMFGEPAPSSPAAAIAAGPGVTPGVPPARPSGASLPPGAPPGASAALAEQPPGTEGIQGVPTMPPNPDIANKKMLLAAAIRDPSKSTFDIAKELRDLQASRYKTTEKGVLDLATGLFYATKGPADVTPVQVQIRTLPGMQGQTISVSTDIARDYNAALQEALKGSPDRLRSFERMLVSTFPDKGVDKGVEKGAGKGEEKPVDPRVEAAVRQLTGPQRIATTQETEAGAAAAKETAVLTAKDKVQRTAAMMENGLKASENLVPVQQLKEFSQGPNANRIFGPFTNPKLLSQVVRLAETGVGMSGFNIGIPAVRDVVNNLKLNPEEQRDLQLVGQLMIRLQMSMTPAERGPGSVTEFERRLFAQSRITPDDTPATVRAKIDSMLRTYKYQIEVADRLQQTGMQYDDLIRTPEGSSMYKNYLQDMTNLVGNLPTPKPSSAMPGSRKASPNNPDRKKIDTLLGGR